MEDKTQSSETDEHDEPDGTGAGEHLDGGHDEEATSAVLVEVASGVVAAYGDLPAELGLEALDLTLIPDADRQRISNALSTIGNTATVAGNVANAAAGTQGLFRMADVSMAKIAAGGSLAAKDGANLGTILLPGGGLAQARFIPVSAAGVATIAASVGPALAMVALQASLNQLNDLARTNIALTNQVLTEARQESWSELSGLVTMIEQTVGRARQAGVVTENLWLTVAGQGADLRTQRILYRRKVDDHVKALEALDGHARREYLENNAEAIVFDSYALLSSLKAWAGHQALHAARERAAGPADSPEARLAEAIVQETSAELGPALDEITKLVGALSRELQLVAELPGRSTLPGTKKRKDNKAARGASRNLLEAIQPLANQLLPPLPELPDPDVLCLPDGVEHQQYLTILRLLLPHDEPLRAISLPHQVEDGDVSGEVLQLMFGGSVGEDLARRTRRDLDRGTTLVAVTDRRILTSPSSTFRRSGRITSETPLGQVRYVRRRTDPQGEARERIDLVTRDTNVRWTFHSTTDTADVDALAAVLAESMTLPESERAALVEKPLALAASSPTSHAGGTSEAESDEDGVDETSSR